MQLSTFKQHLSQHPEKFLRFVLPDGTPVAPHAHVTEAARVVKHFIDCGGTVRQESYCRLQTWVYTDLEHRLPAKKLLGILEKASSILGSEDLAIDVEHEVQYISQFPIQGIEATDQELRVLLGLRHTACLAMDKCCPTEPAPAESLVQVMGIRGR